MIEKANGNIIPDLIPGAPVGISIYSVTQEAPHHHEGFMEIIYCFKGPIRICSRSLDMLLEDGDIISCDPFDVHYMSATGTEAAEMDTSGADGSEGSDAKGSNAEGGGAVSQPAHNANAGGAGTSAKGQYDTGSDDTGNLMVSFYFDLQSPVFEKPDLDKLYFICEPSAIPESKQENLAELKEAAADAALLLLLPASEVAARRNSSALFKKNNPDYAGSFSLFLFHRQLD